MSLFRKNTIFHVEESLPDPEELKLRFRRRVLLFSLFGFLGVLGAPVARDLRPYLHGRVEARRLAENMLAARTLAAVSRMPVGLELTKDGLAWQRKFYSRAFESCEKEVPGPVVLMPTEGLSWKLLAKRENGESLTGQKLCWIPGKGLLLDTVPLENANLLISIHSLDEGNESLAQLLVSQAGAELQTISH